MFASLAEKWNFRNKLVTPMLDNRNICSVKQLLLHGAQLQWMHFTIVMKFAAPVCTGNRFYEQSF